MTLPGQPEEEFTVRKYKEDLGKPYNRITLYLCPKEPVQPSLTARQRPSLILRVLGKILSLPAL